MPHLTDLRCLLIALLCGFGAIVPSLAQEQESTRGVRILDDAGQSTPAPAVPPPPAAVTPPPPTIASPPAAAPPPAARLTPPAPTLAPAAPTLTPPVPTLTSPAPTLTPPAPTLTPTVPTITEPTTPSVPQPTLSAPAPVIGSPPTASLAPTVPDVTPPPRTELPVGPIEGENSAGISLDILPGNELQVGQRLTLRVSTKRAGYLVLVDIDAAGKVTQLYPNVRSLMTTPRDRDSANLIKPGAPVRIPNPANPYAGFELVASPPAGVAMVLAMLSDRPVQVVDLPDVPTEMAGQTSAFGFLQEVARKLRIAAARGPSTLQPARWSFDAKFYVIR